MCENLIKCHMHLRVLPFRTVLKQKFIASVVVKGEIINAWRRWIIITGLNSLNTLTGEGQRILMSVSSNNGANCALINLIGLVISCATLMETLCDGVLFPWQPDAPVFVSLPPPPLFDFNAPKRNPNRD